MAFRFGLSSPSVRNAVPAFTTIRRYDEGRSCMEIVGGEAWEWGKSGVRRSSLCYQAAFTCQGIRSSAKAHVPERRIITPSFRDIV